MNSDAIEMFFPRLSVSPVTIDGIHSIFLLWQLEGKGSCDVDSMVI